MLTARVMKHTIFSWIAATIGFTVFGIAVRADPINLGAAGPGSWAILEIGNGNVSIANASNAGSIVGNVGVAGTGGLSDSGTPLSGGIDFAGTGGGNLSLSPSSSIVSGPIMTGGSALSTLSAAQNAAVFYSNYYSTASDTPVNFTNSGLNYGKGTFSLAPGVYNVNGNFQLNGAVLSLTAGATYIFNISGQMTLQGGSLISDATPDDVLYNFTGTQGLSINGGLNQESILDGLVLAPDAQVAITPGIVNGEIISGQNVQIASGASVDDTPASVPDGGSTALLIGAGFGLLLAAKKRLKVSSC
jgi:hypothetical protein